MKSVQLAMPEEIVRKIDPGTESIRDVSAVVVAIDALDVTASIITLASLRQQMPQVARAIRSWVTGRPVAAEPVHLLLKGPSFEMKIELPPNVQTAQIVDAISQLVSSVSESDGNQLDA